ncbi:hypothetical protein DIS24_g4227 [Lasiodiplodia hormozganensis]|uniref:AB hydrolase-1 domain-containing protein n=1 Tax=Lasiodiplodia hormozganensis TaxID=869390 RepID=A0AA40D3B1_9PEZI|nr:hypothetical protein DIS24_g4227 [Lasiodiplodia hormozganensis]
MAGGFRPHAALSLPYATGITITVAGAAALLYSLATTSENAGRKNVIPSPRTTLLPQLSAAEQHDLPYPPDGLLPGARDVDSPYGSVRVYEWGPEDGPKVLLVHGISTPCIALAAVAEELVRSGRRVMLFDLFGRGFSDSPTDLPYDARLYTTQILLALASSPLSWTGSASQSFSIVGYSLGGGIAADFASYFYPRLVSSLVLIAPGGVMRRERVSWKSWWLYDVCPLLMPQGLLRRLVGRRLYTPVGGDDDATASTTAAADVGNAAQAEAGQVVAGQQGRGRSRRDSMLSHPAPLLGADRWPHVTAAGAVNWQLAHHRGFVVPAFVSSMRCAPIYGQQERWRVVGEKVEAERVAAVEEGGNERKGVLLLLGKDDPIVLVDEVGSDAVDALGGEDNVRTVVLEAGHEVPMSKPKEVVRAMVEFWEGGV